MPQINLRPKARQFPFDETCSEIVSVLESRHFNIPGIDVKFHTYGCSYTKVWSIEGSDFRLWFSRVQGQLGRDWNDTAAINQIVIGDISLSVWGDGSGPSLYVYVGTDLQKDMKWWLHNSWDLNAKLLNRPRKAIYYQGSCRQSGGYFRAGSNHYLVQNNDLGRAYSPIELTENQIPHHSHNWSIDQNEDEPKYDVPKCVLALKVFDWVNQELKKRLEILRK